MGEKMTRASIKVRNIIWLDLNTQNIITELSARLHIASNVLIAEMVKYLLKNKEQLEKFINNLQSVTKIKLVEKKIVCPIPGCNVEIPAGESDVYKKLLIQHLREKHNINI